MTKATLLRLHNHYSKLAEGKFQESDFNFNLGSGGSSQMGEMPPQRKQLIISDAKKNLENLEKKHPDLFKKEEEKNVLEKVAENKASKKKAKK